MIRKGNVEKTVDRVDPNQMSILKRSNLERYYEGQFTEYQSTRIERIERKRVKKKKKYLLYIYMHDL